MTDAPEVLLHHHLKKLRLPTFLTEYAKLAKPMPWALAARGQPQHGAAEDKGHVPYLLRLCELELIERERRMIERRIKATKFPTTKSLDSFNFKVMASLNKPLTMELVRIPACRSEALKVGLVMPNLRRDAAADRYEFVDKRDNVIALGPSGTGSEARLRHRSSSVPNHVALGLGLAACQKGLKVRFTTAVALVHELIEAADERRLQPAAIAKTARQPGAADHPCPAGHA